MSKLVKILKEVGKFEIGITDINHYKNGERPFLFSIGFKTLSNIHEVSILVDMLAYGIPQQDFKYALRGLAAIALLEAFKVGAYYTSKGMNYAFGKVDNLLNRYHPINKSI